MDRPMLTKLGTIRETLRVLAYARHYGMGKARRNDIWRSHITYTNGRRK